MNSIPLVKTTRSGVTECTHYGSIVVVKNNKPILVCGNPYHITPMRSTGKPFFLLPLIEKGGIEKWNLNDKEIAIMASSHNGEKVHRDLVSEILNKIGMNESDINCGTHEPYFDWVQETGKDINSKTDSSCQLYHNCSGKHAGMLMLCKMTKEPTENYWDIKHPIQKMIFNKVCNTLNFNKKTTKILLDGCGVPTYSIPLVMLAESYQILSDDPNLEPIKSAILNEPYMIAGRDRVDTEIIKECGFIAKSGSDGIFCLSIPEENIGIALKIESGSDDAAESAAIEVLDKIGLLTAKQKRSFEKFRKLEIKTSTNICSGHYEPIF